MRSDRKHRGGQPIAGATRGSWLLWIQNLEYPGLGREGNDLCIGRKATNFLLRVGKTVVDADLEYTPARALQCYLRTWSELADEIRRRTGARFIVSLAAVLDFDAHSYDPYLWAAQC
jgi:hypothetical protein